VKITRNATISAKMIAIIPLAVRLRYMLFCRKKVSDKVLGKCEVRDLNPVKSLDMLFKCIDITCTMLK